jgi:hypothetical protein
MDTHVRIIEETVLIMMGIVNNLDRTKAVMVADYPNWDDMDTAALRTQTIAHLQVVITKLGGLV